MGWVWGVIGPDWQRLIETSVHRSGPQSEDSPLGASSAETAEGAARAVWEAYLKAIVDDDRATSLRSRPETSQPTPRTPGRLQTKARFRPFQRGA
jgi:hypothetical protein